MSDFVVPPRAPVVLPIAGGGRFAVRRVYCVGRNYAAHAREMGGSDREAPFFFTKPADAIVVEGGDVAYPPATRDYQHEVELVLAIGEGGADIPSAQAAAHILGCAVGLDMTRRDLQAAAKKAGQPWDMAKGFDQSAPCSAIVRGLVTDGAITLAVDGTERQRAILSDMIWSPSEIVAHLSQLVTLAAGDLIFTGTPSGVGPVTRGARIHARIEGVGALDVTIV